MKSDNISHEPTELSERDNRTYREHMHDARSNERLSGYFRNQLCFEVLCDLDFAAFLETRTRHALLSLQFCMTVSYDLLPLNHPRLVTLQPAWHEFALPRPHGTGPCCRPTAQQLAGMPPHSTAMMFRCL